MGAGRKVRKNDWLPVGRSNPAQALRSGDGNQSRTASWGSDVVIETARPSIRGACQVGLDWCVPQLVGTCFG